MQSNIKLKLMFKDRIGIIADVSALIAKNDLNIVSMEVERKNHKTDVYVDGRVAWSYKEYASRVEAIESHEKADDL